MVYIATEYKVEHCHEQQGGFAVPCSNVRLLFAGFDNLTPGDYGK